MMNLSEEQKVELSRKRIKSPMEIGVLGKNAAIRAAEAVETGIPLPIDYKNERGHVLSEYFAPLLRWEICAIQGQASNGKTAIKDWWIDKTAKFLQANNREEEIIIDGHLEETLEQVAFSYFSKMSGVKAADFARGAYRDIEKLGTFATQIGKTKVWHIGRSEQDEADAPPLTLSYIYRAIMQLKSGELTGREMKIALFSIDYLQALPFDEEILRQKMENQRRLQVARDVNMLREKFAASIGAPGLVPLQAKQKLDNTIPPYFIPQMYDGQETANIAQRFDRIISVWMPSSTHPNLLGSVIEGKEKSVPVGPNNFYFQVIKQRGGLPKGEKWHLGWDFETGEIKQPKTTVERVSFNG